MPVMQVRVVGMGVRQPRMPVRMHVRLAAIPWSVVRMLMVCIMHMLVGMLQLLVHMRVLVMFR